MMALLPGVLSSAFAVAPLEVSSTGAVLTGGSAPGAWDVGAAVGFPWTRMRAQWGRSGGWTPLVEVDTALFSRWRPAVGVSLPWADGAWRVSGEVTAGWLEQTGTLSQRGPSASLGLRTGRALGRVLPYLHLGTEHTLLVDRLVVDTAEGDRTQDTVRHAWTLTGAVGVGIAISSRWGLDLGLDLPWVEPPRPSLPGLHLGVQLGGGS